VLSEKTQHQKSALQCAVSLNNNKRQRKHLLEVHDGAGYWDLNI
jgi:hypothetical protein